VLDAASAVVATLKTHLETTLAQGLVMDITEGWESVEERLRYPTIVLDTPTTGERIRNAAQLVDRTDPAQSTDPNFTGLWSVGTLVLPVTVDVFADSFTQRATVLQALEVALHPDLDDGGVLQLTASAADYNSQGICVYRDSPNRFSDSGGRVLADEWRGTISLVAEVEEIIPASAVRLLQLDLDTAVEVPFDTEPTENRTIFQPT